ncbi:MAG: isochorismatase family protein [Porphyrobacter sp.]|nr:isochorismatase family protein [Porphyrobacter sp.]
MSLLRSAHILFVDLQEGLVETVRTQPPWELRRSAGVLFEIAQTLDLPSVASTIPAGPASRPPLISELATLMNLDAIHTRRSFSALDHEKTATWAASCASGVLLIAGIVTEGAVLATALDACERGWPVHVVIDVCAGLSRRTEEAAIRQIEEAGGVITSIVALVATGGLDLAGATDGKILAKVQQLLEPSP